MRLWSRTTSMLRNLFRRRQVENQLDEEVHAYVSMLIDERIAAGMSAPEARRTAQAEFGGIEQVKQAVRDHRAGTNVELLWQDARFGLRQLRRKPGFSSTVIVTLALSIGANTAIFSIVNALMLKSLPYPHPEHMGTIFMRVHGPDPYDGRHSIDGALWESLRDNVPALASAVYGGGASGVNLQTEHQAQFVHAGRVSAHFFDVLGVQPTVGRNFSEDEDRPNATKTVILSYALWHSSFRADRNLVGQTVRLRSEPYTVIGILPQGAISPLNADLYTALQPGRSGEGGGSNFEVITRLRDGATWQEADAEINRAWNFRIRKFVEENPTGGRLDYYSVPLQKGQTTELRPKALALMMAAGFILLIACANLAGLTLVRTARRIPEIGTRLALGASKWQIQRQLWIESLSLAGVGGMAGVGVGFLALHGLLSLLPEHYLPLAGVPLDGRVLAFTLIVSVLSSVLFGMLPAFALGKVDLRSSAARTVAGDRLRLRQALIAGEVALTVVLLASSGLIIRTLLHLQTLPPGFNATGVMTAKASLDDVRYHDQTAFNKLLTESIAAMRKIPGVTKAAVGLSLPYERTLNDNVRLSDHRNIQADEVYVTPGYFETLQISLLAGRTFIAGDGFKAQRVMIVNRTFAQKFFPGENPVGRTVDKDVLIIGVVSDIQLSSGLNPTAPLQTEETMYIPAAQVDPRMLAVVHAWFQPSWIVRTTAPVEGLTVQMQRALNDADPSLPFSGFYSMADLQAETLSSQRIEVALLSAMAGLALLLSTLGIFALVANIVAQRTREIGIRIALGSTIRQAMVHIGLPGAHASALGLMVGLVLCGGALRVMRSVLYGVGVYDASTIFTVVLGIAAVTAIATVVPTLRIAAIDPAKTLRDE